MAVLHILLQYCLSLNQPIGKLKSKARINENYTIKNTGNYGINSIILYNFV